MASIGATPNEIEAQGPELASSHVACSGEPRVRRSSDPVACSGEPRVRRSSDPVACSGEPRVRRSIQHPAATNQYRYLYFDPAFAGRHSPLLDIVKPLFHNVFAMWMYFSREIAQELQIAVKLADECISVEHNYRLTPIRQALLHVKQEELVKPLVAWLREQHALPEDWRELLNLALMCCPLLTVNPFDTTKRTPEIGWLGLAQAVQLGNGELIAWKEGER